MGQIAEHDPQPGQGLAPLLLQLIEPQLIASGHCLQTPSKSNARFWGGIARRSVEMIRPAVQLPDLPSADHGISNTAAVFGRLQRWKGPHILCAALRLLGSRGPIVDWYGGVKPWGSEGLAADRFLAEGYPDVWGHKFHHHAAVPRTAVADRQARALFNIVPSTWDVFNFTAVEAMAAGRPTIVSTGAGASELIVDGQNGFTFANQDPEDLAAAIDRVLSLSDRQRREIGMTGRETVRTELDPVRITEERLVAYEEAIQSFNLRSPLRPSHWLTNVLEVPPAHQIDPSELLESFPMRTLGKHLGKRLVRKFG
jgi:glycosyltransferase involved in cell wall biosynthesis